MSSTADFLGRAIAADRVAEILGLAAEAAYSDSRVPPRRSDVVWYALKEAMDTINRLPDREAGWLYCIRSMWPEVANDYLDRIDAYETMLERVRIGEEPVEAISLRRPPPSPQAISRMEQVFGWHVYLVGKNRRRDWRIVCQFAGGWQPARVAKSNRVSKRTVYDRRELQSLSIANGLRENYGEGIFEPLALIA